MLHRTRNVQTQRNRNGNNQRVKLLLLIAQHGLLDRIPPQYEIRPDNQQHRHHPSHEARKEQPLELVLALKVLGGEDVAALLAAPAVAPQALQRRRVLYSRHGGTHLGSVVVSLDRSARTRW